MFDVVYFTHLTLLLTEFEHIIAGIVHFVNGTALLEADTLLFMNLCDIYNERFQNLNFKGGNF